MRIATYTVKKGNEFIVSGQLEFEGKGYINNSQMDEVFNEARTEAMKFDSYDDIMIDVEEIEGRVK